MPPAHMAEKKENEKAKAKSKEKTNIEKIEN